MRIRESEMTLSMKTASKRLALVLLAGMLSAVGPWAVASADPPRKGLVACWSFDACDGERVADVSGGEHHGKIAGEPELAEGVRGKSLRLDGLCDYVAVEDADALDFSKATFSVSGWVNVYALTGEQQMIVAKNVYSANQREWGLMIDADGRFRLYLRHEGRWETVESQTMPVPGRWYHVAVTVDAGRANLYVNGKR